MISRILGKKMRELAAQFPIISITGPRQSGKTTLVQAVFPKYQYVSLEDPDNRDRAKEDPRRFLRSFRTGVILDEIQKAPDLFSYIQTTVDAAKQMGQFILTGSQNFLLMKNIGQSLSGRVAVLHLLPFGLPELFKTSSPKSSLDTVLFTGMYPAIYDRNISPQSWHSSYISTYLERDVRLIKNITDLDSFQKFMRLCAGRSGQLLNLTALGSECGISHTTAKAWLSVLQASFIVFLLQPYYKNFNKRIVKQPKLYFYDTGLLCNLLGLQNASQLQNHYYRGAIFETFMVSEFAKHFFHNGKPHRGFFWRDHRGNEIDYLLEDGNQFIPIEMKSGETVSVDFFKPLEYFHKTTRSVCRSHYILYGGDETQERKHGTVISWKNISTVFKRMR